MKMFDAMLLKRELMRNCSIDVEILETFKDGLVLRIEEMVDMTSLAVVRDFVGKHQLNMLFENDVCFISNQILAPLEVTYLSE